MRMTGDLGRIELRPDQIACKLNDELDSRWPRPCLPKRIPMSASRGRIVWRVRTSDGKPLAAAFDALILATDSAAQDQLQPSRLIAVDTPFERELPDIDLMLVVRTNVADATLVNECDVFGADGSRRVYGCSRRTLAVFVCSERGIRVTGLPAPGAAPDSMAT
jgi:hypothetical protein